MRRLNSDFAKRGLCFTQEDLKSIIAELAPGFSRLDQFFKDYVTGTEELNYDRYLAFAGLGLVTTPVETSVPGFRAARQADGGIAVRLVEAESQAEVAGLREGDVITQLNGHDSRKLPLRQFFQLKPGQEIRLKIRRGNAALTLRFTPDSRQEIDYEIVELSHANSDEVNIRNEWLEGRTSQVLKR